MQGPAGLADMLASALRGGTKAALGFPGDMEGLARSGINAMGGAVDPKPVLPNSDRVGAMLPDFNPISDTSKKSWDTTEKLGEFVPAPTVLAGVPKMASMMSDVLRGRAGAPAGAIVDEGRRGALRNIAGAGLATAAAPAEMAKILSETLRAAPTGGAAPLAGVAAKTGGRAAALTAAAWANKLLEKVHSASVGDFVQDGMRPTSFDEVAAAVRKLDPKATDEDIASIIERNAEDYGVGGKRDTGEIEEGMHTAQGDGDVGKSALRKMGITSGEKLNEAVLRGKVSLWDLDEEAIGMLQRARGPWTSIRANMSGGWEQ